MKTAGQILKESREKKRVSLDRVAQETKIGKKYLAALEKDDYQSIPSVTTAKGLMRNYAQFLEIDPEGILAVFRRDYQRIQDQKLVLQPGDDLDKKVKWNPKKTLILVIVLFVLAFSAYLFHQYRSLLGKPELEIYSPENNKQTTEEQFVVKGKTDPDNSVSINGNLVQLSNQGEFSYRLRLTSGENEIVVEATSRLGKKTKETRTVFYTTEK